MEQRRQVYLEHLMALGNFSFLASTFNPNSDVPPMFDREETFRNLFRTHHALDLYGSKLARQVGSIAWSKTLDYTHKYVVQAERDDKFKEEVDELYREINEYREEFLEIVRREMDIDLLEDD